MPIPDDSKSSFPVSTTSSSSKDQTKEETVLTLFHPVFSFILVSVLQLLIIIIIDKIQAKNLNLKRK